MKYLMVTGAPMYRLSADEVAMYSPFAEHLSALVPQLRAHFSSIEFAAPTVTADFYERNKHAWEVLNEADEGLHFTELHPRSSGYLSFWIYWFFRNLFVLTGLVRNCDVVHSSIDQNPRKPFKFIPVALAILLGKKSLVFVDIDHRESSRMKREISGMPLRAFLISWLFDDRLRRLQLRIAGRYATLVLAKSKDMIREYCAKRGNGRYILNAAHSEEHVINQQQLEIKTGRLLDSATTLEVAYFGRLVTDKGIEHMLRAIRQATLDSKLPLHFTIIGDGPEHDNIQRLVKELEIEGVVTFGGTFSYGEPLFSELYSKHVLLGAPLAQDTPRSALDAMAAGMGILAYDTYYYRDLAESGAVRTVPWADYGAMAEELRNLNEHRQQLADMMMNARIFALENTQQKWLDGRLGWTLEAVGLPLPESSPERSRQFEK